jgi:hypothetical protein
MRRLLFALVPFAAGVVACASKTPEPDTKPEIVPVRVAGAEAPLAHGDCVEAVRRAVAKPDLDVEKVPEPLAMKPGPIDTKKMPKGVADKNGYFEIKFQVLVDTLGKPDMKTFSVVRTTHPWLATSVKNAVAKWTFAPAELAGCKVPRTYTLGISPKGKTPAAAKTAAPPAKPPVRPTGG